MGGGEKRERVRRGWMERQRRREGLTGIDGERGTDRYGCGEGD